MENERMIGQTISHCRVVEKLGGAAASAPAAQVRQRLLA
jgi:hypothetical protein